MPPSVPVNIIFACHASIYSTLVLDRILLTSNINVLAVVESTCIKRRGANFLSDVYDLIRVSGLTYAIYLLLITSVFSCISVLFGTASIKQLCKRHKIPIIKTSNINSASGLRDISVLRQKKELSQNAEVFFVTVMFNQKIASQILEIEGLNFINLHPGQLPEYRGVDPVLAAMINRESAGIVSLHELVESLDEGDLLIQQEVAIAESKSLFANNMNFFKVGAEILVSFLTSSKFEKNSSPQQGLGNYYSWPTKQEVAKQKLFAVSDCSALKLVENSR